MFHCWNQAFWIVGSLGCSPIVNSSWCREEREGRLISPYHVRLSSGLMPRYYCRDTTPLFTQMNITFGNQRFSNCCPTADAGFMKLTPNSFCAKGVFRMNNQFCCPLCCISSVIFRNNPQRTTISFFVNVGFCPLYLFADIVFPWFVYADITLETVTLDTPNNVAVYIRDAPAKCLPTICPLSKSDKSPIFRFFHTDCHST
jgi:hypothetical protein